MAQAIKEFFEVALNSILYLREKVKIFMSLRLMRIIFEDLILVQDECWQRG